MPQAALEAFSSGLVHREAERVVALLRDPDATGVVVVTLPEEMPANETCEIYRGLDELRMHTALLVVNQLHSAPCTRTELDAVAALTPTRRDRGRGRRKHDADALLAEVVARAEEELGWAEINAAHVRRLADEIPVPTVKLPYLFNEEFGPEEVCMLGRELATQLDAAAGGARPARAARPR
jgi:anion-transporting  ArsA/GET3 family ATPase